MHFENPKTHSALKLGWDHLCNFMEALHMESMGLHRSCALHQKLFLYDFIFAVLVKIVLKSHISDRIHFGSAESPPYGGLHMESIKS
jgi:hypothetical protein